MYRVQFLLYWRQEFLFHHDNTIAVHMFWATSCQKVDWVIAQVIMLTSHKQYTQMMSPIRDEYSCKMMYSVQQRYLTQE
jgi:hypothetical protein